MVPPTGHVTLYPVAGIPSTLSAIILVRGRHGWTLLICRIVNPDADIRVIKYRRNPGSEGKNHPTLGRDLAKDREPGAPIRGGLVPRGLLYVYSFCPPFTGCERVVPYVRGGLSI